MDNRTKIRLGLFRQVYLDLKAKKELDEEEQEELLIARQFFDRDSQNQLKEYQERLQSSWTEYLHQHYTLFLVRIGDLFSAEKELVLNFKEYKAPKNFLAILLTEVLYFMGKHFKGEEKEPIIRPFIEQIIGLLKR